MFKNKIALFSKRKRMQLLVTLSCHILNFSHGIGFGWVSPTVQILQTPETPFEVPITVEQVSWIGSTFAFGFLCGNIIFGLTVNRLARKYNMYLTAFPHMLFWILNYFAQSVEYIYAGRFFAGLTSGGLFVITPIFLSEILDIDIRGALMSMGMMFVSCGVLVGFILPTKVNYYVTPCIAVVFPIFYLLALYFFPDTPHSLLKRNRLAEAEAAFNFYKGIDCHSVQKSNAHMDRTKEASGMQSEFEEWKAIFLNGSSSQRVRLQDFFERSAIKAFADTFVLCILYQFSGCFVFINYMTSILAESGSTMDPYAITPIVGASHILGTFCATMLVERFGRRALLFSSIIGLVVGMYGLGAFVQFTDAATKAKFDWVPLAFMIEVVFMSAYGLFANFFTITVEILPAKIRSQALSISMCLVSILAFVVLKVYPYFLFDLGITVTMYTSATICMITTIYLYAFLAETKGKSMDKD
ncbi:PREDICTED: facilitated trehalose transporter Tret1-like [Rhagoletis zephyria]|uniref:facilitated trehalose transporter Tret1-like n=1 Tax=Rhagoletis zephyria TaxID=28612 RepID=UPI0008118147|nr:PREDICTED: facilitated trehalose transporter Tret1-like [Rhagoletis zephyria]